VDGRSRRRLCRTVLMGALCVAVVVMWTTQALQDRQEGILNIGSGWPSEACRPPRFASPRVASPRAPRVPRVVSPRVSRGTADVGGGSSEVLISCISDIHADRKQNLDWVRENLHPRSSRDVLIVAGDISHRMDLVEETLRIFTDRFSKVFFVPGNHELWVETSQSKTVQGTCSMAKLEQIDELCAKIGVETTPKCIHGVWVCPLLSWYDLSLSLTDQVTDRLSMPQPETSNLTFWPWSDFTRCSWPEELEVPYPTRSGRFPVMVADVMLQRNEKHVQHVASEISRGNGHAVVSVSHFLPRKETLPDWLNPNQTQFNTRWVGSAWEKSAYRFSKVAGSSSLDHQLRTLSHSLRNGNPGDMRHVHVFGHSHRPKDFLLDGVRYVHNPLAKPVERERGMVPEEVYAKELWRIDASNDISEHIPAPAPIIRYWAERFLAGLHFDIDVPR